MFICENMMRRSSGEPHRSVRLVENRRFDGKLQQRTLLNLGARFSVPEDLWPELVEIIEAELAGNALPFDPEPELVAAADAIVRKIRGRRLTRPEAETFQDEIVSVDLDKIEMGRSRARSVGCERLALDALDALGLHEALGAVGLSDRDARIALALVMARMVHPAGEFETLRWLKADSATLELLRLDTGQGVTLDKIHRLGDVLAKHRHAIEDALFERRCALSGTSSGAIFHDLTKTHMTGGPVSPPAKFGRSGQKRDDCPPVALVLATDEGGFLRRSSLLPGDIGEPGALVEALDSLAERDAGSGRPTVIMDADLVTEDTLAELGARGYHWIAVRRSRARPDRAVAVDMRDPDVTIKTGSGQVTQLLQVTRDQADEVVLCIRNPARPDRDAAILAEKRARFESELADLHAGLSKPRRVKKYDKVLERLGRLRERYAMVDRLYDITVEKTEDGLAGAIAWARNEVSDALAGPHIMRTTHTDWDLEKIVRTYWRLTRSVATFEFLASKPDLYRSIKRIEGHLFIAVLAHCGANEILTRLAAQGIHDSWALVRDKLARWQRVSTIFADMEGVRFEMLGDTLPNAEACAIAEAAGLPFDSAQRILKPRKP